MIWFVAIWCWLEVALATKMLCVVDLVSAKPWRRKVLACYALGCCSAAVMATVMAFKGALL